MRHNNKMPLEISIRLRYLHQDKGVKISQLVKRFSKYSKSSVYFHAKLPTCTVKEDARSKNPGRPRLLDERDKRKLVRSIAVLRESVGSFNVKRLRLEAGIDSKVSDLTVRRLLNREGYRYLQSRKKGLMSTADLKARLKFARKAKYSLPQDIWTDGISFYLDGTSFVHKTNPCDQACSTKAMAWRKRSEGLSVQCTCKGKKEGTGGRMANFMVAIAYNHGVNLCEQYEEKLTGQYFADFIREHFDSTFLNSPNPRGKLFLQDGDPRQNSALAKRAMSDVGARLFAIPPRSPDINPIENFFHLIQKKLAKDALELNITKETFKQFSKRVKRTMINYPTETINSIITSMGKRMTLIIAAKGQRIKY